jgi:hypothetical protein
MRYGNKISASYQFIHKTIIVVDEGGPSIDLPLNCEIRTNPIIFNANHPFIYGIRYNISTMITIIGEYH